ncbi:SH3 domain-containing protein [Streptomyces sp. NBC_00280]|uniref:SH3 domain-containing protein n=1 Tax=Streptomyces sp. NBC_00280 TaxID=2975699 RepID=UPI0032472FC6
MVTALLSPTTTAAAADSASPAPRAAATVTVPAGVTAGVAVFDRQTGTFTEQLNPTMQFRSASIVKLLIALDYLWNRDPAYEIPAADRTQFNSMLRSSDDDAASDFWVRDGGRAIVTRMSDELELANTNPPPADQDGMWGYTTTTAADTVKIYRYLLDQAPAPVRELIMGQLRQSTRCSATDSFDQHFGIAGAFNRPWAVKQGWSGFGGVENGTCGSDASALGTAAEPPLDVTRPALHTTGTVGTGDRSIVAVFTLHPVGATYGRAYTDLGRLTRSLTVPGGVRPTGTWFGTWSSDVNVRAGATTDSDVLTQLPAGVEVLVGCQKEGQTVSVPPYTNQWWAYLPQYGGYVTNIYISSPGNQLPNVPLCSSQQ